METNQLFHVSLHPLWLHVWIILCVWSRILSVILVILFCLLVILCLVTSCFIFLICCFISTVTSFDSIILFSPVTSAVFLSVPACSCCCHSLVFLIYCGNDCFLWLRLCLLPPTALCLQLSYVISYSYPVSVYILSTAPCVVCCCCSLSASWFEVLFLYCCLLWTRGNPKRHK